MLGYVTTENLNNDIRDLSSDIAALEQQLAIKREEKKAKENELQAIQTLVAAGNSAIEQARNFLALATHADRQDLIASFWEEMDEMRERQSIGELPGAVDPVETDPNPQPDPDDSDDGNAIAVEIEAGEALEDVTGDADAIESKPPLQAVGSDVLRFSMLTLPNLRKECQNRGISKNKVKEYGSLTKRQIWIDVLEDNCS